MNCNCHGNRECDSEDLRKIESRVIEARGRRKVGGCQEAFKRSIQKKKTQKTCTERP
jgi:hypothetical protein